jgi:leucyl aminopeptidase
VPAVVPDSGVEAFVVGAILGSFRFLWKSSPAQDRPVERIVLAGRPDTETASAGLARAVALGRAGWRSRMLSTVPSNLKNPPWLAEQAETIGADSGLAVTIWDEKRLAADGFGGILAVGKGSATPPRLVRLDYSPRRAGRRTPTIALVGKGITFDTGGLSIKPGEAMVNMKRDMTGGAVVMATMAALADVGCPVRVVGLVAAAENAIGSDAFRPGDVIRHYGGRTSEVTNTDAEGRLVLADAMAYAVDKVKPDVIVDVATLTGAMKVALGQQVGGFFTNRDDLASALRTASALAGEPLWRFPLCDAYESKLSSKVADADNGPSGPGAITAALFLQHFVGGLPWVHLDIASVGDSPGESFEWTTGPTGFGARALLQWLGTEHPLEGIA